MTESDYAVCIHESAHVVLASKLGLVTRKLELNWENGWLFGYTSIIEGPRLSNYLTVLLSGEVAETEIFGKFMLPRHHAGSDREQLFRAVVHAGRAGEQAHVVAKQTAPRLVRVHKPLIVGLAHDLMAIVAQAQGQDVTVEGDELARLLGDDVAVLRLAMNG